MCEARGILGNSSKLQCTEHFLNSRNVGHMHYSSSRKLSSTFYNNRQRSRLAKLSHSATRTSSPLSFFNICPLSQTHGPFSK